MTVHPSPSLQQVVRKLESIFRLSGEERDAVLSLTTQENDLGARQDIIREGDRPSRCCVVLQGIASTYKMTGDGKRQILAFHIPGDTPDLQSLHLPVLDTSVATITPCKVGFVRHEAIRNLCTRYPRIGSALWRDTLVDASIFREWMTSIGRRDAPARIAHLLCEMFVKMKSVGLADGDSIDFPITQAEIGDALGISHVHVNRSLMALRGANLIRLENGRLTILDWDGLESAGDFDPAYLHLTEYDEAA